MVLCSCADDVAWPTHHGMQQVTPVPMGAWYALLHGLHHQVPTGDPSVLKRFRETPGRWPCLLVWWTPLGTNCMLWPAIAVPLPPQPRCPQSNVLPILQAEVRGKFPHRVYLRSMRGDGGGWDDESIPPHVRNAAQNIMSAYEGHRSRKLKAGPRTVLPESVRSAFECVRDGMGACCSVGAATLDAGFWNIPPDATFHSFFDQDNIAVVRLPMLSLNHRPTTESSHTVLPTNRLSTHPCVVSRATSSTGVMYRSAARPWLRTAVHKTDVARGHIAPGSTACEAPAQGGVACVQARLKMVASLCVIGAAGNRPGFGVDAAKSHWDCLQYERCPGSVPEQDSTMEVREPRCRLSTTASPSQPRPPMIALCLTPQQRPDISG